MVWVVGRN